MVLTALALLAFYINWRVVPKALLTNEDQAQDDSADEPQSVNMSERLDEHSLSGRQSSILLVFLSA